MKDYLKWGIFMAPFVMAPGHAQADNDDFYKHWVDVKNGEVSVAFNHTPVRFALEAFQAKTGFNIVLPPSSEAKTVNLRLDRQPVEPAVRSLISTIGFKNFAMVYDQKGQPLSAVVLSAEPAVVNNRNDETPAPALSLEERDRLKKELDRWTELKADERSRIEERLRNLPASDDRDILVREYGRQVLAVK